MPKMLSASEYERPGCSPMHPKRFRVTIERSPHSRDDIYTATVYADSAAGTVTLCSSPPGDIDSARAAALEYQRKLGLLEAYRVDVRWLGKGERPVSDPSEMQVVLTECAGLDDCLAELVRQLDAKDKNVTEVHVYTPLAAWPKSGPVNPTSPTRVHEGVLIDRLASLIKMLSEKGVSWSASHNTQVMTLTHEEASSLQNILLAALRTMTGAP